MPLLLLKTEKAEGLSACVIGQGSGGAALSAHTRYNTTWMANNILALQG